jgi:uncharacterized protein DUF2795
MQELRGSKIAAQFLRGLDYPMSKAELLAQAREAKLAAPIIGALQNIPERDYENPEDVTRALNAAP